MTTGALLLILKVCALVAFMLQISAISVQIVYIIKRKEKTDPVSHWLLLSAAVFLFLYTALRSLLIGFVALTTIVECLVFFSAVSMLLLFIYRLIYVQKLIHFIVLGGSLISLLLLAIASSPLMRDAVHVPIPELRSLWLVLHVSLAFIGEAFFLVAFVVSIIYLLQHDDNQKQELEKLLYRTVVIGYLIFTAGALICGAIWARHAWGRYWSFDDPKETWAFITWLTYTAYLHTRFFRKWRGKLSALLCIIGFLFTLFTLFGVSYLLEGPHSYL
ncbi:MAG: cytochrome c biogenesis protein CcsA [Spirochaetales bacterium]|nr:cytochrome c biogenesis protein CcsA [Spirochaetales bacterium]